jgi:hypothetical protein
MVTSIAEIGRTKANPNYREPWYHANQKGNAPFGVFGPSINIVKAIYSLKRGDAAGLLYLHADLLVTHELLRGLAKDSVWAYNHNGAPYAVHRPDETARIDALSEQSLLPTTILRNSSQDFNVSRASWGRLPGCNAVWQNIRRDTRLTEWWSKDGSVRASYGVGRSDMAYISLHTWAEAQAFASLLDIFVQHRLYLECAIPSAFQMVADRFNVSMHHATVLTSFGRLRGKLWEHGRFNSRTLSPIKMMRAQAEKKMFEAVHPVRLSNTSSLEELFNEITLRPTAYKG